MTDEALKKIREMQTESIENMHDLSDVFDTDEKLNALSIDEKAQRLEHEERKMRLEEDKQRLESDKFEHQKKQDRRGFWIRVVEVGAGVLTAAGLLLKGIADVSKVYNQRKYVKEAYALDQVTTLTSQTARNLLKDGVNPRLG